jgi:hypothetical protein
MVSSVIINNELMDNPVSHNANKAKPRIIGGMFGLEEDILLKNINENVYLFLKEDRIISLVNARSCISVLIELLSPAQVWLPSYLCDSILTAVNQRATSLRFYKVSYDLTLPSLGWENEVEAGDLVVSIDYFGFMSDWQSWAPALKERGAWLLEDACQALLSQNVGEFSDFVLFSPRKFLGIPDGGILFANHQFKFPAIDLDTPPAEWWLKALFAGILRRDFDIYGDNRHWFKLFQEVEQQQPLGHYSMSEFSHTLLLHNFDFEHVAQQRIVNFHALASELSDIALFSNLPPGVVPSGFPICTKKRDKIRQALFEHEIYPPIHWVIQNVVPKCFPDNHRLSAEILTLPCDQRYGVADMERMSHLVKKELK